MREHREWGHKDPVEKKRVGTSKASCAAASANEIKPFPCPNDDAKIAHRGSGDSERKYENELNRCRKIQKEKGTWELGLSIHDDTSKSPTKRLDTLNTLCSYRWVTAVRYYWEQPNLVQSRVELRQRFELANLRSRMSGFSDQMGGISVQNKVSVCQRSSIDRNETSLVFCLTLTNPNGTLGMKQIVPQPTHAWR